MPGIPVLNGLRSEDIAFGDFWEEGADASERFVGEGFSKVPCYTLVLTMKDANEKYNPIKGHKAVAVKDALIELQIPVHIRKAK